MATRRKLVSRLGNVFRSAAFKYQENKFLAGNSRPATDSFAVVIETRGVALRINLLARIIHDTVIYGHCTYRAIAAPPLMIFLIGIYPNSPPVISSPR